MVVTKQVQTAGDYSVLGQGRKMDWGARLTKMVSEFKCTSKIPLHNWNESRPEHYLIQAVSGRIIFLVKHTHTLGERVSYKYALI